MISDTKTLKNDPIIDSMFKAGAHFAYAKSRRHPSAEPFIFGVKNKVEIFDLEKTKEFLEKAKDFVRKISGEGGQILFVGGKNESRDAILNGALSIDMPYVAGRWIGGTITNASEIEIRIEKLKDLVSKREKGELSKYTKKERLVIDREIEHLEKNFRGLVSLKGKPQAIFVIDSKKEKNAVSEGKRSGIPIIALQGSDCDIKDSDYPIPANDSSIASIRFFVNEIVEAYKAGKKAIPNSPNS